MKNIADRKRDEIKFCTDSEGHMSDMWDKDPRHAKAFEDRLARQGNPFVNIFGLLVGAFKDMATGASKPKSDHEKAVALDSIKPTEPRR